MITIWPPIFILSYYGFYLIKIINYLNQIIADPKHVLQIKKFKTLLIVLIVF